MPVDLDQSEPPEQQLQRLINTIRKTCASPGNSPQALIIKTGRIIKNEGLKGLTHRLRMTLALNGTEQIIHSNWHQIYSYPQSVNGSHLATQKNPLTVSVIVPNYNHAAYLRKRLDSIYQQTYPHTHVLLLDDASTDNSRDILREYAKQHSEKTTCLFNEKNSGGVFHQWLKGFEAAKGDLVWIAESDDYCTPDFLEVLVAAFQDEAIRIAFCRTEFKDGDSGETIWSTREYLQDLGLEIWDKKFIASAHSLTKNAWVVKNIIPNVSSCIFRHPRQLSLLQDHTWKSMRLCGDWIFYLAIARAGLVAYDPATTNYYRQHSNNTSVTAHRERIYYQEHRIVQDYLLRYYKLEYQDLGRLKDHAYRHWCIHNGLQKRDAFEDAFNSSGLVGKNQRRLNIAIATYALISGGGETLPLMLANLLYQRGHAVTVLDFNQANRENDIRKMLLPEIPLIVLGSLLQLPAIVSDMSIDVIHSQHAWVDINIASLLINRSCKHLVTMHGMYEMMAPELFRSLQKKMECIDGFIYTARKNLKPFSDEFIAKKNFKRIDNAVTATSYVPVDRCELGIGRDDFVLCMIARGRPDKGWHEAIDSVLMANEMSIRPIQLLLIGDGDEPERLKPLYANQERIHFLGFQGQIRSFLACSDIGFIPSRFPGESFPLVLIDSLMCGKPVLASAIGEIEPMLTTCDGLAGIVFPLEDWQIPIRKLADIIVELANDRESYQALLDRVEIAANKFNPINMAEQYEIAYESM